MSASLPGFVEEYRSALEAYLAGEDEAALERAYELGRQAVTEGLGVLEMAEMHQTMVAATLIRAPGGEQGARTTRSAGRFFLESLSPYEMTHRGFREANVALHRLNESLEEQAKRIAHALHDDAGQLLVSVHLALEEIARDLPAPARKRLQMIRGLLDQIEEQQRRLSHELRPTVLDDLGLLPALEFLGQGASARTGISVHVASSLVERLPPSVETSLYRIFQESLNNVTRHSKARHVRVQLQREAGVIRCSIRDDGQGFDTNAISRGDGHRGLGLLGIRERVDALKGKLVISSAPGSGTELLITIPVET